MDFAKVLAELARFFEEHGFRFGIAGAHALHAHGHTRATRDLDLVVEETARPALLRFAASLGYEELHASAGFSNHLHAEPRWGRLDFIYLDGHTANLLFAGATRTELFPAVHALVPRAGHLAAMKIAAMKADPRRGFQEMADLLYLLQLPGVDEAEVRGYFEKHGLLERFDELKRAMRRG